MTTQFHHIGANSGIEGVAPVACSPQRGRRFAIWAANGGSPTQTRTGATTTTTVEAGTQTFTVLAQELGGTARAELTKELPVPKRGWRRS